MPNITTSCPDCSADCNVVNIDGWTTNSSTGPLRVPVFCICGCHFWLAAAVEVTTIAVTRNLEINEPKLPIGTMVRHIISEHALCGQQGPIVAKKHMYYRVDFGLWNGLVWVPEHHIEPT